MGSKRETLSVIMMMAALLLTGCGKKTEETPPVPGAQPVPTKAPAKEAKIVRTSICLNGEWDFLPVKDEAQKSAPPKEGWRKVRVPSVWVRPDAPSAGAKSAAQVFDLPHQVVNTEAAWYRLSFPVPKEWADGRQVALEFRGINRRSRLFINGESADETEGAHLPICVDLTKRAKFGGLNEVAVLVEAGPQPVAGLWRGVYLRSYPSLWLQNVQIFTSVRKKEIAVKVWIRNDTESAHRVILKNAILEWGGDKRVNIFGDLDVGVEPGESKIVEVKRSWPNPRLWGFGEYGEPVLYMLRSELRSADTGESGGATLDVLLTRFGFREFWTSGKQFMFNGKPFFIKGDVFTPVNTLGEDRRAISLLYQAERGANVNFIRLKDPYGFAPSAWYEVADELGMLIEPEACAAFKKSKEGVELPDEIQFDALKNEWEEFIKREGNHPCIVMYSCDNETCTHEQEMVEGVIFAKLDELHQSIRLNDPSRVIEEHGDVQLGMGAKLGIFKELQVFNVHLKTPSSGAELEEIKKKWDYSNLIPIHVGEMGVEGGNLVEALKALKAAGAAGVSLRAPRWYDVAWPTIVTNAIYESLKKARQEVDGQAVAPLSGKKIPTLVVGLAPEGKPHAGAFVFMKMQNAESRGIEGAFTDSRGTAWLAPIEPGEYLVWAELDGKKLNSVVKVQAADMSSKPDDGHVIWVDLTPDATAKIKAEYLGNPR